MSAKKRLLEEEFGEDPRKERERDRAQFEMERSAHEQAIAKWTADFQDLQTQAIILQNVGDSAGEAVTRGVTGIDTLMINPSMLNEYRALAAREADLRQRLSALVAEQTRLEHRADSMNF